MGNCFINKKINPEKTTQNQTLKQKTELPIYKFDTSILPDQPCIIEKKITNTIIDNIIPQQVEISFEYKSPYEQALQIMKEKGDIIFYDYDFPATEQSLSDKPQKFGNEIVWKRPKDFLENQQIQLYHQGISPTDIIQGNLGDCYFLSSLSVVSEIPKQIEKLFKFQFSQQNGLYIIYLFHNGLFQEIVIDDQIPCYKNGGPIFSRTNGNEIWVLLLEKAYAKLFGSYGKIELGQSMNALRDLTGAPCKSYQIQGTSQKDMNECWNFLEQQKKLRYIITASSLYNNNIENVNKNGIVTRHSYAILDLQNVTDSKNFKDKIIKIRNPWGEVEWNKDWSDKSNKWTYQLRKQLNVQREDDGIFWMSIKDFIKEFRQVVICMFNSNYLYSSIKLNFIQSSDSTKNIVLMKVYKQTHVYITLSQKDQRYFDDTYKYSQVSMIIGELDTISKEPFNYCGSICDSQRDVFIEKQLKPAEYAIFIKIDWQKYADHHLAISTYSDFEIQLVEYIIKEQDMIEIINKVFD